MGEGAAANEVVMGDAIVPARFIAGSGFGRWLVNNLILRPVYWVQGIVMEEQVRECITGTVLRQFVRGTGYTLPGDMDETYRRTHGISYAQYQKMLQQQGQLMEPFEECAEVL